MRGMGMEWIEHNLIIELLAKAGTSQCVVYQFLLAHTHMIDSAILLVKSLGIMKRSRSCPIEL